MKLRYLLLSVILLVGCGSTKPPDATPAMPFDHIRVKPGPTDPDAPTEFTTTESGLKYRILRKSDGPKPTPEDAVRVHYRGTLDNGEIFDSTYGRTGGSNVFKLKGLVPGWVEGLQLIGEGGMIELEVPYELGYGKHGHPPKIPPKATLHFIVELMEMRKGLPEVEFKPAKEN